MPVACAELERALQAELELATVDQAGERIVLASYESCRDKLVRAVMSVSVPS